ncbi:MAG: pyridoxal phosphate-dependent aminotransferase [Candidatus Bathyarchaeia archaeon]
MEKGGSVKSLSKRSQELKPTAFAEFFAEAVELQRSGEDVIHLHVGEPDFRTPKHIVEAAQEAIEEGFTHYTPPGGFFELREAISEKLKRDNNIEADPEDEVCVLSGGYNALYCAVQVLIDPGDEVIVPEPCLPQYWGNIILAGGRAVALELVEEEDFKPDLDKLQMKVSDRTKVLLLNTPQNPTGSILTKEDLEEFAAFAENNDLTVISDEVYEKFLYGNYRHVSFASLPGMGERTLTINSFSKTYAMTGWRVGYAAGESDLIAKIRGVSEHTIWCPSSIAQKAAIAALRGPQGCVREMVEEFRQRRDLITAGLNQIKGFSCKTPKGAFYAFPSIEKLGLSSMELAQLLLRKARVATVPGVAFGPLGERNIRLSFANSKENISKALVRIGSVVEGCLGGH